MSSDKKVVFITGGNTGLGLEIVKALYATSNAYAIIIGCRNPSKGEEALTTVQNSISTSSSTISVIQADLSSDTSLSAAIDQITSTHGRIDTLINNGGAGFDGSIANKTLTIREAFNASWDTNVSGTQVLTTLSIPLLLKSADPRLVFLTSGTSTLTETEDTTSAIGSRINAAPEAGWPKAAGLNPITSYRSSKCGLNMLMREWARLLRKDGVKVWAVSPGFLATGLGGVGKETLKKMGALEPSVGGGFVRDVVEGKYDDKVGKVIRKDMVQPW